MVRRRNRLANLRVALLCAAGLVAACDDDSPVTRNDVLAFVVQPSDVQVATNMDPAVQVAVQDAGGDTRTDATGTVTLTLQGGRGTLNGGTAMLVDGVATFSALRVDAVGTGLRLVAAADGFDQVTSQPFDVTPGPAAALAVATQPSDSVAGEPISPAVTVQVEDRLGNLVSDSTAQVTVALGEGPDGATLSGTTMVTAVDGVATFSDLAIDTVGTGYTLTFSSEGLTGVSSEAFDVTAPPATQLVVTTQPADATAGATLPAVTVALQDAAGNTVTDATGDVTVAVSPAVPIQGTLTQSASMGVATFDDLVIETAGDYTLTFTSSGLTEATSESFTISPGSATQLVVTAPSDATAGEAFTVTVRAADAFGNTDPSYTGSVAFSSTDSSASLPAAYTFVQGDAGEHAFTDAVTLRTAGAQTLTAADQAGATAPSGEASVTVAAAAFADIVFSTQPSDALVGVAIDPPVAVTAQDAFGNTTDTSGDVTVSLADGTDGASLGGTATVSLTGGVASFADLTVDLAGLGYTLAASCDCGGTAQTSDPFNVLAAPELGDLVISELMHAPAAPAGNLALGKWFEVTNTTTDPVSLAGLTVALADAGGSFMVPAGAFVEGGDAFVFGAAASDENGGVEVDYVYPDTFDLTYGDTLRLSDAAGVVDEVDFGRSVEDGPSDTPTSLDFPAAASGQATTLSANTLSDLANDHPWYWCNAAPSPGAVNGETCGVEVALPLDFCETLPVADVAGDVADPPLVAMRLSEAEITDRFHRGHDGYPFIEVDVGFGDDAADPAGTWTWQPAAPDQDYEGDATETSDQFVGEVALASVGEDGATVTYGFRARFFDPSTGAFTEYTYCDDTGTQSADGKGGSYPQATLYSAAAQLAAALGTPAGSGLSLRVVGGVVTYIKDTFGGDEAGFFVQSAQQGPALFVKVDPSSLTPAPGVGDRVSFTVTDMATEDDLIHATGITDFVRISEGTADVFGLMQDVSDATDLVSALDERVAELIGVDHAVLASSFRPGGSGFSQADLNTPGLTGADDLVFRVPEVVLEPMELEEGCDLRIGPTPLWRFRSTAQVSAWQREDVRVNSCPAPRVVSANASSATTVDITFSRSIKADSVLPDGSQFSFDNGLTVDSGTPPVVDGKVVTVTTTSQTAGMQYSVTVADTVKDQYGGGVSASDNSASFTAPEAGVCTPAVVISQVYNSGGLSGATYKHDFIELHNRSSSAVDISGWSIQKASATKDSWQTATIPESTIIAAGGYFLIKTAGSETIGDADLPAPDLDAGTGINFGGSYKVALTSDSTALSGTCPTGGAIVDFVGVGSANCAEGSNASSASARTDSLHRAGDGCTDTNDNSADFSSGAASPRNSSSAPVICMCE